MPTASLNYADNLQSAARWGPNGLAFKTDKVDEFSLIVPTMVWPALGETLTTASIPDDFDPTRLANFTAPDQPPVRGEPANVGTLWKLFRITALASVDVVLNQANRQPNDLLEERIREKRAALVQVKAAALANGDGKKQWLGFDAPGFPKTVLKTPTGTKPEDVLATLKLLDDATLTHERGRRASAYVTDERTRRNLEAAQEMCGLRVRYGMVPGVANPVPFYRERPIVVSSGLYPDAKSKKGRVYAFDLTQTMFVATSGTAESECIGEEPLNFQESGSIGLLLYVHGALVTRTNCAVVCAHVTNTLSA